jgi:hypothetical protein
MAYNYAINDDVLFRLAGGHRVAPLIWINALDRAAFTIHIP